ncbi:uncharacterized protein LOC126880058 [Diabrotica virgifera virgifera]|uniref:Uncharacterized protein n=1 Tax=Diabrotica virgifera virgifera TaxID=50390 RepID=A0ABM5JP08_DIAVI|nr:uncharacterized protein LOC126880058 [Diabrotica virgifera virgifera]
MTSAVFNKFSEIQNSLTSYQSRNLINEITMLNKASHNLSLKNTDMFCNEEMPADDFPSDNAPDSIQHNSFHPDNNTKPSLCPNILDFNSDDSVLDEDYIPDSSEDSDDLNLPENVPSRRKLPKKSQLRTFPTNLTEPSTYTATLTKSSPSHTFRNSLSSNKHKKRRVTTDFRELRCI